MNMHEEGVVVDAKADPKKPYKMYGTMVVAFLTSIIASGIEQPAWAVAIETALIAALTVYYIPNPIKVTKRRTVKVFDDLNDPALWD